MSWDDILKGTNGADLLSGGNGDDFLQGRAGNDTLNGDDGNDLLHGDTGDDKLRGGRGDDYIHGGLGTDTAYYSGSIWEYSHAWVGETLYLNHVGGSMSDGNDRLLQVERLVFADAVIDLTINNAPVAFDDVAATHEDVGTYSGASVLANDFDWEGNTLAAVAGTFNGLYGKLVLNANGTYTYTPHASSQALAQGQVVQDVFTYTVTDGSSTDTGTLTISLAGVNDAPKANADAVAGHENQLLTINVLANDTDVDNGAVLTVTAASAPVGKGTAFVSGNQVKFDPGTAFDHLAAGATEVVVLSYTIADEFGATSSATVSVTVTGTNDGPVAAADTAGTNENGAITVNVLANDTDVDDGAVLTVTSASAPPGKGVASVVGNKVFYDPGADFDHLAAGATETLVVAYTIQDEHGASSSATLTITVTGTNDGPVANSDAASTGENAVVTVAVLANDNDADDGAVLTVTAVSAPLGKGTASIVGNQVQFDPGADFDHLAAGATETVVLSYTVSDEFGATSSATVTVTVTGTNDGPVAAADSAATSENAPILVDVLANDTDADDGAVLTVTAASAPAGKGTASIAGNQVSFDPGTDFDHLAAGAMETVVVSYTIEDEHGASSSSSITITVTGTNDGPIANPDVASTGENASATIDVLANDTDADDGAVLTLTAASAPAGQGSAGVVGNQVQFHPGSDFDHLAAGETATVVLSYTAKDEHGASSGSTVTVTVTGTNDAPTIDVGATSVTGSVSELPDGDPAENSAVHNASGSVAFDDLDLSDTHSASASPQGSGYLGTFTLGSVDQIGDSVGWNFNVSDGALDGLAAGEVLTQVYTITVSDGNGGTTSQDVTITITGADDVTIPDGVWFIDNAAVGSANLGTYDDPFTSIAAFNAAQGTAGGPEAGHTVYLRYGTGTYAETDGINLLDGQVLIGAGEDLIVGGNLIEAATSRPTISATAGDGVNVAADNSLKGFNIGDTSGADIADSGGSVGTLTISDVALFGTGQILDVDEGGTLDVTLDSAASTASSGGAIDLAGVGGTFTVTGATTIAGVHSGGGIDITGSALAASFAGGGTVATLTATAVNYAGNSGSLHLGGGFDIVITSGAGLNASGGGTVTVTGAGSSVTSTTGTAVSIVGTAIGAAGVTFESVSANGAASGIVLADTGNAGFFLVSGDGSQTGGLFDRDGSGGTIQNTTGDGISLTNAYNVTIRQMNLTANGQTAGEDAVESNGGGSIVLSAVSIDTPGDHGWRATNLGGVSGLDNNSRVANWQATQSNGVAVTNTDTNFTSFTVADSLFTTSATGGDGFFFDANGATSGTVLVLDSEFTLIDQDAVQINNDGSGILDAVIQGSHFHDADATSGDGNNTLVLALSGSGTLNFPVGGLGAGEGNIFNNLARTVANTGAISVSALTVGKTGSELNGWIEGNSITNILGRDGISIAIEANGGTHGTHAIEVGGNTINNTGLNGLRTTINSAGGGSISATNLSIVDNVMTNLGINPLAGNDARSGIDIKSNYDNFASGGDMVTNLLIQDNVVRNNAASGLADTLEIAIRGGNVGTDHTANITILGNEFRNNGGTSVVDIYTGGTLSGTGIKLNLDMNSDNLSTGANDTSNSAGAAGSIQLRNPLVGAMFSIEDLGANPAATFVSDRNSHDSVTVVGFIGSTGEVTMPAAPDHFWP